MFALDIRTLSFVTMLFSLIFFVGLYTFSRYNPRFDGFKKFAYANLFLFLGFLLISLRGVIPQALSIIAANLLIALAFFLFYYGSVCFLRRPFRLLWLHILGMISVLLILIYFTYFDFNVNIRIIAINFYLFLESFGLFVFFVKESAKQFRSQKISASLGFLIYGIYSLIRIVVTLEEDRIPVFLEAGSIHGFTFVVLQILIVNSSFAFIWIANSILNDELETQARIDPLTNALNRRAFVEELDREVARSKRESLTFSLIMVDIDHFKTINDEHGHLAGDSVLISFARTVTGNLRINDILARYGGEEFVMILPNTNKQYAGETAERIRKIIEMNTHPFNGKNINYTVSLGVASFDLDAQNKDELLEKVDVALYQAKTKGRNRVETG